MKRKVLGMWCDTKTATAVWEVSMYSEFYEAYDGEAGLYVDSKGNYFVAIEHKNSFSYNGSDFVYRLIKQSEIDYAISLKDDEKWEYLMNLKRFAAFNQ